jgi:hypothetical protein
MFILQSEKDFILRSFLKTSGFGKTALDSEEKAGF